MRETTMPADCRALIAEARTVLADEHDAIANAANLAAFVIANVADVNWVGFYFVRGNELVLGPFAGKPAVTRIARGRGVCGAAWVQARTLVVDDVSEFSEHIACDVASQAELVVPLMRGGSVFGVLDCDSPVRARFTDGDRALLEGLARLYVASSDPFDR